MLIYKYICTFVLITALFTHKNAHPHSLLENENWNNNEISTHALEKGL